MSWSALGNTGFTYCNHCGLVGRGGARHSCIGPHTKPRVGSQTMAIQALRHDWRDNPAGFAKHFGGGS